MIFCEAKVDTDDVDEVYDCDYDVWNDAHSFVHLDHITNISFMRSNYLGMIFCHVSWQVVLHLRPNRERQGFTIHRKYPTNQPASQSSSLPDSLALIAFVVRTLTRRAVGGIMCKETWFRGDTFRRSIRLILFCFFFSLHSLPHSFVFLLNISLKCRVLIKCFFLGKAKKWAENKNYCY